MTYTTAPLRTNQKYIYSNLNLQLHKFRKYAKHSDLYAILYQRLTKALLKGALLRCKRASFTPQKSTFYHAKEHLLPCKRASFTVPKLTYYFQFMNLYYNPSYALFPFHNKQITLPLHYYNNTIKTTTFQFSCHSRHFSTWFNTLTTRYLREMLKVTATKHKNYVRV